MPALAFVKDLFDAVQGRHVGDENVQQFAVFDPLRRRPFEEGVEDFFVAGFLVDPRGQGLPMRRPVHHQVDPPVPTRVRARGHRRGQPGPDPARNDPIIQPFSHARDMRNRQGGFLERNIDVLTAAGSSRREQGDHAARRRAGGGHQKILFARQRDRWVVGLPGHVEGATDGSRDEVRRFPCRPGTALPEAANRGENDLGLFGGKGGVADSRLVEASHRQGFEDDIGAEGKLSKERATLRALDIQGDPPLARIHVEEMEAAVFSRHTVQERRDGALASASWSLDLDDVRAHVGQ